MYLKNYFSQLAFSGIIWYNMSGSSAPGRRSVIYVLEAKNNGNV